MPRSTLYLDHNATTAPAAEVVAAVADAQRNAWGNPSSPHPPGRTAKAVLDRARLQVARLLGAEPGEIVFTGGGTESNNAAILGAADALAPSGKRHVVTTSMEHPAVVEPCRALEARGFAVTYVAPDPDGAVDAASIASAIREDTALVTVMHAHNETGVLQPVEAIARAARERGALVHTDAAQAVGKIRVDVRALGVDLLTVAAHKLYGPKGVGALFVRDGVRLVPVLHGAGHESGRRPGTEAVPAIAGFGAACALALAERERRERHARALRDRLEALLRDAFPAVTIHGERSARLPNTTYAAIPGVDAAALVARIDGVAIGTGSACHEDGGPASSALDAMGVSPGLARASVRITTGRDTTESEIEEAVRRIAAVASGEVRER